MKKLTLSGLAILGVLALGAGLQTFKGTSAIAEPAGAAIAVDKAVAPFTLPNHDGKPVTVGNWAEDGTKATVVLFIATKCPVSNNYNTRMAALADNLAGKGVRVIGINSNKAEDAAAVAKHSKTHNFNFPVLKDANNIIADRFAAQVTPEAYVIDSAGVLRYHGRVDDSQQEANVTSKDLQNAIDAVLAGKPVAVKTTNAFGCSIKRVG